METLMVRKMKLAKRTVASNIMGECVVVTDEKLPILSEKHTYICILSGRMYLYEVGYADEIKA